MTSTPETRKLSTLRLCDSCNGPLAPTFVIVRVEVAVIDQRESAVTLGLIPQVGSLQVAEAMSPTPEPIKLGGLSLTTELLLCVACQCKSLCLGQLVEQRNEAAAAAVAR